MGGVLAAFLLTAAGISVDWTEAGWTEAVKVSLNRVDSTVVACALAGITLEPDGGVLVRLLRGTKGDWPAERLSAERFAASAGKAMEGMAGKGGSSGIAGY